MYVLGIALLLLALVLVLFEIYLRSLRSYKAAGQFPGARVYPLIQNSISVTLRNQVDTFKEARKWALEYGESYRFLIFGVLFIQAIRHKDVEMLLSSSRLIRKSLLYKYTVPLIGDGLLNSTGAKWHQRRRILTPTFHFNILQSFLHTFHEECSKIVLELSESADKDIVTELQPLATQVTLNSICETAMGIKLDATDSAEVYKENVSAVGKMIQHRVMNPLFYIDSVYKAFGYMNTMDLLLAPVRAFTRNIIKQRRQMFHANIKNVADTSEENFYTNIKQRYAMLDSLLLAEAKQQIDAEGIREEVDTFTMAGQETTGNAIVFITMLIAQHQDVQERVYQEICSAINEQSDPAEPFTFKDYGNLKYMERVIKEGLRLYPPVPMISRVITEDVRYADKWIPKETIVSIEIYDLHRDPEQFPDPERFDPDRFLPENVEKRNPYAYIPFSAGLRNCIEAAMGVKLDSHTMADLYRAQIKEVVSFLIQRVMNPLLFENFTYKLLGFKARLDKALRPIHAFTDNIIKQRRELFHANVKNLDDFSEENIYFNTNQRYALLDTLLASEARNQINEKGIREEVNTFMFRGHDTTASAFTFIFLLIAEHPVVQQALCEEIESVNSSRTIPETSFTVQDYNELRYMDRVIKECLRLFPPVPYIGRTITEDSWFGDRFIPKNSMANVLIWDLHRDPKQFPDPERFDPDRFLPENVELRNPYAYVPFSAGPRNCIDPVSTFMLARELAARFNDTYGLLLGSGLIVNVIKAKESEALLSSTRLIDKNMIYTFLHPFLGVGLLNSTGSKWFQRRKILTAAFHFNILPKFLITFQEECKKLVQRLDKDVEQEKTTSLQKLAERFTLNTICEAAMGVKLDSHTMADEYRAKIKVLVEFLVQRVMNPWLYENIVYKILGLEARMNRVLKPIHAFTNGIIKQRRKLFHASVKNVADFSEENIYFNTNQRYALLDTLLASEARNQIDEEGLREEVNTFMFRGHDTTASAVTFILFAVAEHSDVQEKLFDEIGTIRTDDLQGLWTVKDYNELRYMDRVIKECLRLYPPVPFIGRTVTEDSWFADRFVPKGSMANVHIWDLHRDPEQFPDPERFDPDRFLPENVEKRNPYAYVPFSAGPRNCIGQRFAMLELKAVLTAVLRKFRVLPVTKREEIVLIADLVLRTRDPVKVKFERRNV